MAEDFRHQRVGFRALNTMSQGLQDKITGGKDYLQAVHTNEPVAFDNHHVQIFIHLDSVSLSWGP